MDPRARPGPLRPLSGITILGLALGLLTCLSAFLPWVIFDWRDPVTRELRTRIFSGLDVMIYRSGDFLVPAVVFVALGICAAIAALMRRELFATVVHMLALAAGIVNLVYIRLYVAGGHELKLGIGPFVPVATAAIWVATLYWGRLARAYDSGNARS